MTERNSIPSIVGMTSCRACGGHGRIKIELHVLELIEVITPPLEMGDKLQAIKDVRVKWDMGLKQAKEMVEAYQEFADSLIKIVVPVSDR